MLRGGRGDCCGHVDSCYLAAANMSTLLVGAEIAVNGRGVPSLGRNRVQYMAHDRPHWSTKREASDGSAACDEPANVPWMRPSLANVMK